MSGVHIPERLRGRVRRRAKNRCEFCGYPQDACALAFECDHFLPVSRGGMTEFANLVWACPNCNGSKRERAEGLDPQTQQIVPLFNPRHDT